MRPIRKAVPVHPWPGPLTVDGAVFVLATASPPGDQRPAARARIRLALREAIAQWSGRDVDSVTLAAIPGQAPRVLLDGAASRFGLSISHAEGLSVAAIRDGGALGLDLMTVTDLPDWRQVARDYLGCAVAEMLAATAPAARAAAFARAWTAREAQLKCLGLALGEWAALPVPCRCLPLALPAGMVGTLALA